jgi:hypothetical protein
MNFLNELIVRLFANTPWFFRVLQILSVATALITGLPEWLANSGVNMPEAWQAISNEVVSYAAMVAAFVAQLTTTSAVKKDANLKD